MLADYGATYQPSSPVEQSLVEEMTGARWRILRLRMIETALFDSEIDRPHPPTDPHPEPTVPGYQIPAASRRRIPRPLSCLPLQSWVRTEWGTPLPVAMTWHHVIPYSVLRDCWNALANHQRKNAKAKVSLQIYMRLLGFENAPAKALIKAMADGALDSGAQERIETAVAYPP